MEVAANSKVDFISSLSFGFFSPVVLEFSLLCIPPSVFGFSVSAFPASSGFTLIPVSFIWLESVIRISLRERYK